MLTIAITIITQSKPSQVALEEASCSIWVPIAFVTLNAMIHTSITTQGRYWMIKSKIDSFYLQLDALILHVITTAAFHLCVMSNESWIMPN